MANAERVRKQVLRFETRGELAGGLVAHIAGHKRPETARADVDDPIVELVANREAAVGAVTALLAERKRRKVRGGAPCPAVEFVLAGPPGYGEPGEFSRDLERSWAVDTARWLVGLVGPKSVIHSAVLHRDETAPHVHVLVVPVADDGTLGWTNLHKQIGTQIAGVPPGRKAKRGAVHAAMHDDYYRHVSARYGIPRGQKGSKATHKQIDRQKAAENAARFARAEGKRVQQAMIESGAQTAREIVEGNEAVASAHGVTITPKARRGAAVVAGYKREIAELQDELASVREAVKVRAKERDEAYAERNDERARADRVEGELSALKKAHSGELEKAKSEAFEKGKAEGIAEAEARVNKAEQKARAWAEYAKRMESERDRAGDNATSARIAAGQWQAAADAAHAREAEANARAAQAEAELSRVHAGVEHGEGAAGVEL